jgi:hypothetical protein
MMLLPQPSHCAASTGELSDSDISEINELLEDEQPTASSNLENKQNNKTNSPSGKNKRRPWTPEEDRILRIAVQHAIAGKQGSKKRLPWLEISKMVDGRTAKQCRDRWTCSTDISSNKSWTKEEDNKLLELYAHYTNRWVQIASHFENRNDNMIKSRFRALQRTGSRQVMSESEQSLPKQNLKRSRSKPSNEPNTIKRARSSTSTIDFETIVPVRSPDSETARSFRPLYPQQSTSAKYIRLFQGHTPVPDIPVLDMTPSVIYHPPIQQQVPIQASTWTKVSPEKSSADYTSFLMDQIMP